MVGFKLGDYLYDFDASKLGSQTLQHVAMAFVGLYALRIAYFVVTKVRSVMSEGGKAEAGGDQATSDGGDQEEDEVVTAGEEDKKEL